MRAITKYITSKMVSSVVSIWMVKRGGIKNISHIKALNAAESKTGKISNSIAIRETVSNRIKATVLYPIKSDSTKQIAEASNTPEML